MMRAIAFVTACLCFADGTTAAPGVLTMAKLSKDPDGLVILGRKLRGSAPVGASCSKDPDCASGSCHGNTVFTSGTCQCTAACNCCPLVTGSPQTCTVHAVLENSCGAAPATNVPIGGTCSSGSQCASGKCDTPIQNTCECTKDSDCSNVQGKPVCNIPLARENTCVAKAASNVPLGGGCGADPQCSSGKCYLDSTCECAQNSDCAGSSGGSVCNTGGFGMNKCGQAPPSNQPLGASCSSGSECTSGKCFECLGCQNTCECNPDNTPSKCPAATPVCNSPVADINTCVTAPPPGRKPPPGDDGTFCSVINSDLPSGAVTCTCHETPSGLGFKLTCLTEKIDIVGVLGADLDIEPCANPASLALTVSATTGTPPVVHSYVLESITAGKKHDIGVPGLSFDGPDMTVGAQAQVTFTGNADKLSVDLALAFCVGFRRRLGETHASHRRRLVECLSDAPVIGKYFPVHILKETFSLGNACAKAKAKLAAKKAAAAKKASGMSGGAVAGIVIVVLVVVGGLVAGGVFFMKRKASYSKQDGNTIYDETKPEAAGDQGTIYDTADDNLAQGDDA